jgi:hypothetical protein
MYGLDTAGAERRHRQNAGRHFRARHTIYVVNAACRKAFALIAVRRQRISVVFWFPEHE